MINIQSSLTVGFGASGGTTFTTDTIPLASFSDNQVVTPVAGQNAIQIKFTKALNTIFVYMPTPATTTQVLTSMTQIAPGGQDVPFTDFVDGTLGLTQSGFIHWRPQYDANLNPAMGEEFILTFNYQDDIAATFGGINMLFCDKFDLLREYPDLDNLLGISEDRVINTQLIRLMESSMLEIERRLVNSPITKEDRQYFFTADSIDRWDLFQIYQINQAAIFWTLGKLFYFLSDTPGDIYSIRSGEYTTRGSSAFSSVDLSVDLNDDGSLDVFEGERNYGNVEITLEI